MGLLRHTSVTVLLQHPLPSDATPLERWIVLTHPRGAFLRQGAPCPS